MQFHQHDNVRKALSDNITHAIIGMITWINVHYYLGRVKFIGGRIVAQSAVCGLISSVIDIDHFILARSFHLKDATSLSRRPFLHCTTLPILAFTVIFLMSYSHKNSDLEVFGWIFIASFLSHHTRDAARRGYWLWPFGSTPPLGTSLYLFLTVLLPPILSMSMKFMNSGVATPSVSESIIV